MNDYKQIHQLATVVLKKHSNKLKQKRRTLL